MDVDGGGDGTGGGGGGGGGGASTAQGGDVNDVADEVDEAPTKLVATEVDLEVRAAIRYVSLFYLFLPLPSLLAIYSW